MSIKIASMNFGDCDTILHNTPNGMKNIAEVLGPNGEVYWSSIKELTGIPPLSIRSNGTMLLDYLISGNMSQSGTPTPTTPIQPQETGERTGNLFDYRKIVPGYTYDSNGQMILNPDTDSQWRFAAVPLIEVEPGATYLRTYNLAPFGNIINFYDNNKNFIKRATPGTGMPISIPSNCNFVTYVIQTENMDVEKYMFIKSSTPLPYEPYGYKIPILSAGTTTNIYLGETATMRQIKKLVLTGEENWVANQNGDKRFYYMTVVDSQVINANLFCTHFVQATIGSTTTNIGIQFAGEVQLRIRPENTATSTVESFKAWLVQQYANGTPVTIWYVLAEPTTGIVNEPLRKIGDYADTVSYEQAGVQIPTNRGNTVIDVLTELKPSQMYIKYK